MLVGLFGGLLTDWSRPTGHYEPRQTWISVYHSMNKSQLSIFSTKASGQQPTADWVYKTPTLPFPIAPSLGHRPQQTLVGLQKHSSHITNMPPTTFSKFSSLLADIRRDIWKRAAQSPSIHFFCLSRGTEDIVRLKQLTDEALRQYARAQGPSWHQLSWNEKRMKDYDVNDPVICNYRASLVGLAPLASEDRARLAGRTASWQREDLAPICTESWRTVREQLARLSGGTNKNKLVAPFVQPHNIICLGMPKPAGSPVFEETSFPSREMGCPYGHQTVAPPRTNCPPGFNPERFDFDRRSTKCHPTLQQACPELATLEKIAFIFEPREAWNRCFPRGRPGAGDT
jgi:hypothetical protein